jgi:hypothetical protein
VGNRCRAAGNASARKLHRKASSAARTVALTGSPLAGSPFAQRLAIGLSGPLTELSRQALRALIGSFPVPPFLLPIYQAAGIDYGVPWQVLAGINEIETNFGRNLDVSSAGAIGWMQFLPSTWARYGVDADGRGSANPYDPVDAIFSAARYLAAAGAAGSVPRAVFAYNHANWYVSSVELRARLLQLLPQGLVDGLSSLMEDRYPVAGHLGAYATLPPTARTLMSRPALELPAPPGAPVIAVADGKVIAIGYDLLRGRYVVLQDSFGNRYTYEHLGRLQTVYPLVLPRVQSAVRALAVPKPVHGGITRLFALPATKTPRTRGPTNASLTTIVPNATVPTGTAPATAGPAAILPTSTNGAGGSGTAGGQAAGTSSSTAPAGTKQRLFANPLRPASYAAGGYLQLQSRVRSYAVASTAAASLLAGPADYFSEQLRLKAHQFTLAPLRVGSVVLAGTVLGRVAHDGASSAILFQVRPAGAGHNVNPAPLVAGWKLLGRLTAGHRPTPGLSNGGAYGSSNQTMGQLLLASHADLRQAVLADAHVRLDACDRSMLATQRVDRRLLAIVEYLSYSGLEPRVTEPGCGGATAAAAGSGATVERLVITGLRGATIAGHTQPGGSVDIATRLLLGLRGALRPTRIIGPLSYPWEPAALKLPDHAGELEVDMNSPAAPRPQRAAQRLTAGQWSRLIARLAQPAG